jgi:FixJ family two-component response regulator
MTATIHLVDDDADVRRALGRLLRLHGYRVVEHGSAADLLAAPHDGGPACLLLDLAMPGVGGLALQAVMRQAGDQRPIVFLTGEGDIASCAGAMKAGAVDYLTKPVDADALLDAVDRALSRAAADSANRHQVLAVEERLAELTGRERQVMELVVAGRPNKQIAHALGIAEKTVKIHRGRVMQKMAADSLADLVRMAGLAGVDPGRTPPA